MLNLHRVLFCTGIDLHDIMQIDCLAYKYFVFFIWYCVVCDYRGTLPKAAQFTSIKNQNF